MQQFPIKKFAPTKKSNGFTFIESLFALIITIILLSFYPLVHQLFSRITLQTNLDQTVEWELFLQQARYDFRFSKKIALENNQLSLKQADGKIIEYNLYKQLLRKQINGKGHEPLLTNIKKVDFHIQSNYLLVTVTTLQKIKLLARFPIP